MLKFLKRKSGPPTAATVMRRVIIHKYVHLKPSVVPSIESLEPTMRAWKESEQLRAYRDHAQLQVNELKEYGAWNEMTDEEQGLIAGGIRSMTEEARLYAKWMGEAMICMLWALGHRENLVSYDREADASEIDIFPKGALDKLVAEAKLRPSDEIEKQRKIAQAWHWRARTHRAMKQAEAENRETLKAAVRSKAQKAVEDGLLAAALADDFPILGKAYGDLAEEEFISASISAQERHRAFNWMCGYARRNRWDRTPIET